MPVDAKAKPGGIELLFTKNRGLNRILKMLQGALPSQDLFRLHPDCLDTVGSLPWQMMIRAVRCKANGIKTKCGRFYSSV
jgi:hypothetical protein